MAAIIKKKITNPNAKTSVESYFSKTPRNIDRLVSEVTRYKPFISFDVETTGMMNGNNNQITQIALSAYDYNERTKQYELQDHIFMLAKPDVEAIKEIMSKEEISDENIRRNLASKFFYGDGKDITGVADRRKISYIEKQIEKYEAADKDASKYYEDPVYLNKDLSYDELMERYGDVLEDFIVDRFEDEKKRLEEVNCRKLLSQQGINIDKYLTAGEGLRCFEMTAGINEFMNTYAKDDTFIMCNGFYAAKHYMDKEAISYQKIFTGRNVIDLNCCKTSSTDHVKSIAGVDTVKGESGVYMASFDLKDFANRYYDKNGVKLTHFDAFTKSMCNAEIALDLAKCEMAYEKELCRRNNKSYDSAYDSALNIGICHNSSKQLENNVKEIAYSMDEEYVLSEQRLYDSNIILTNEIRYADYTFSSLEYVNFGNDKRYVDFDNLFEENKETFEITLEGEKEPIKTWEELETKIKALNAKVSDKLLDKIKEKYEEMVEIANTHRKEREEEMAKMSVQVKEQGRPDFPEGQLDVQHYINIYEEEETEKAEMEEIAEKETQNELTDARQLLEQFKDKFEKSESELNELKEIEETFKNGYDDLRGSLDNKCAGFYKDGTVEFLKFASQKSESGVKTTKVYDDIVITALYSSSANTYIELTAETKEQAGKSEADTLRVTISPDSEKGTKVEVISLFAGEKQNVYDNITSLFNNQKDIKEFSVEGFKTATAMMKAIVNNVNEIKKSIISKAQDNLIEALKEMEAEKEQYKSDLKEKAAVFIAPEER